MFWRLLGAIALRWWRLEVWTMSMIWEGDPHYAQEAKHVYKSTPLFTHHGDRVQLRGAYDKPYETIFKLKWFLRLSLALNAALVAWWYLAK
jgi:hypothetical protein